ncbi:MAG TPA: glycosyl hydrolase [Kiritimatiellia bacterium]|nr:glycosyl hydrolase [Kiritimatiellia bacterium]HPS09546.1 glycosyl hydrolase [Kiritimatiellia bacterium]
MGKEPTLKAGHLRATWAALTLALALALPAVADVHIRPSVVLRAAEGMRIRFVHRRTAAHEVYYLLNEHTVPGSVPCTFRDTGKGVPERWDPSTGDIELRNTDVCLNSDGRVTVKVFLGAHDACFIVFDR